MPVEMVGIAGIEPAREVIHWFPKPDRCQITELHPDINFSKYN
jgi:hypothetical protein